MEEREVFGREVDAGLLDVSFLGDAGRDGVAESYVLKAQVRHIGQVAVGGIEVVAALAENLVVCAAEAEGGGEHVGIEVVLIDFVTDNLVVVVEYVLVGVELVLEDARVGLCEGDYG